MRTVPTGMIFLLAALASTQVASQEKRTFTLVCSSPKGESKFVTVTESSNALFNQILIDGKLISPLIDKDSIRFSSFGGRLESTYEINRTTGVMFVVTSTQKPFEIISETAYKCQESKPKF